MAASPRRSPEGAPPTSPWVKGIIAVCGLFAIGTLVHHATGRNDPRVAERVAERSALGGHEGGGWNIKRDRAAGESAEGFADAPSIAAGGIHPEARALPHAPANGSGRPRDVGAPAANGKPTAKGAAAGSAAAAPAKGADPDGEQPIQAGAAVPATPVPAAPLGSGAGHRGTGLAGANAAGTQDAAGNQPGSDIAPPPEWTPGGTVPGLAFEEAKDFDIGTESMLANGVGVSSDAGTITFCLSPQWDSGDGANASFVSAADATGDGVGAGSDVLHIAKSGQSLQFLLANVDGGVSAAATRITTWKPGDRHQVTAAWGNGRTVLYVDGQLVDQQAYAGQTLLNPDTPVRIGSESPVTGAPGSLNNLQIYNRLLSSPEVASLATGCQ